MVLAEHDPLLRSYLQQRDVAPLQIYSRPITEIVVDNGGTKTLQLSGDGYRWVTYNRNGQFTNMDAFPLTTADTLRAEGLDTEEFVARLNHALYEQLQKEKREI